MNIKILLILFSDMTKKDQQDHLKVDFGLTTTKIVITSKTISL